MKAATNITVSARLDICTFATIARAYEKEGLRLRSKSDIVWQAVEQIAALYTKKYNIDPISDIREAEEYMDRIGMPLGTNMHAMQDLNRAKVYQDAEEDYGAEDLEVMKKRVQFKGMRKSSVATVVAPTYRTDEERQRDLYRQAQGIGFAGTYEEYVSTITDYMREQEGRVKETVNSKDFVAKEKVRMAAEKAAYSPEALRAAMAKPSA